MIFCVEDDSNIRELVVYTLESTGLKARGFEEGSSFLEALALETPDLVLLDIMLPGEDGMELLKKLKASPKTRDIDVYKRQFLGVSQMTWGSGRTRMYSPHRSSFSPLLQSITS